MFCSKGMLITDRCHLLSECYLFVVMHFASLKTSFLVLDLSGLTVNYFEDQTCMAVHSGTLQLLRYVANTDVLEGNICLIGENKEL